MLRLFQVERELWKEDEEYRTLLVILLMLLTIGSGFYSLVEGWSVVDSVYFCIMTVSTVGYGDLTPTRVSSKIFTIFFILTGIGVFVGIATKLAHRLTQKRMARVKEIGNRHEKKG